MGQTNAEQVGRALHLTATELAPWMESRMGTWPADRHGDVAPSDLSYLVGVLLDRWRTDFAGALGSEGLTLVQDLRHTRNRWAHQVPFDDLDAFRGIDTCRRLLMRISSSHSDDLEIMGRALLATTSPSGEPLAVPTGLMERAPTGAHRKMRSQMFQQEQWELRFDSHVAPINQLIDDLIEERDGRWMPYIPAYHGGIESEIVLLYQDPGKMTAREHGGSGFLGAENDDGSAQLLAECLDAADLDQRRVNPWNAYPWFVPDQGGLNASMRREGLDPLRRLLGLMPKVHTVVTGGKEAHKSWASFAKIYPEVAARFRHLETFHTSGQGIVNGGQQKKSVGVAHVVATLRTAAQPPPREA